MTYFQQPERLRKAVTIVEVAFTVGLSCLLGVSTLSAAVWPWVVLPLALIVIFLIGEKAVARRFYAMPAEGRTQSAGDDVLKKRRRGITENQQLIGMLALYAIALPLAYQELNQRAAPGRALAEMVEACPPARSMVRTMSETGELSFFERTKLQNWIDRRADYEAGVFVKTGAEIQCRRKAF